MVDRMWKQVLSFGVLGLFAAVSVGFLATEASERVVADVELYPCVDLRDEGSDEMLAPEGATSSLGMDQAELVISSKVSKPVRVCALSDICYQCPPQLVADLHPGHNKTVKLDSRFWTSLIVYHGNKTVCKLYERLSEHGRYFLWVNEMGNPNSSCNFYTTQQPANEFIPIYVMLGGIVGVVLTWIVLKAMYRRGWLLRFLICMETERLISSDLGTPLIKDDSDSINKPETESAPPPKTRLRSLDAFRGFALIVMVFANYRGGGYWFFHHSAWNGLTVADLVFPWFIFIMGTSMALAFRGMLRRSSRKQLLFKVVKRTLILFFLGLLISNQAKHGKEVDLKSLRILGVLQRIALTYFIVGVTEVLFAKANNSEQSKWWSPVRDLVPYWPQWVVSLSLVVVHTCITFLLPVPDCPTGYLGPGGLQENGIHGNCTGGATSYIDRVVLGDHHMYGHPTCMNVYYPSLTTLAYDPEGILGTLTAIFMCFLGLQAGKILLCYEGARTRVVRWTIWALATGAIAGLLCKFTQNDGWIPVNKNLWSLSYVLALGSMAFFILAVFYLLIDVYKVWSGAPFFYTGMNSILIYMCHELFHDYFPVSFHVPATHAAQLALTAWGTTIWLVVSIVLYHKGIFVAI